MRGHTIHAKMPSGFAFADRLQAHAFAVTGFIDGASKVAFVRVDGGPEDVDLAVRLRPPYSRPAYATDYRDGWAAGKRLANDTIGVSQAYADGYRDAAEGRMKWHLAYCTDHGDHQTGCES